MEKELLALRAELEGMIAENAHRHILGQSPAYGEAAFHDLAKRIRAINSPTHEWAASQPWYLSAAPAAPGIVEVFCKPNGPKCYHCLYSNGPECKVRERPRPCVQNSLFVRA